MVFQGGQFLSFVVPLAVDPKPLVLTSNSGLSWTPLHIYPRTFAPSYDLFLSY
jgi:hypothetical protein